MIYTIKIEICGIEARNEEEAIMLFWERVDNLDYKYETKVTKD